MYRIELPVRMTDELTDELIALYCSDLYDQLQRILYETEDDDLEITLSEIQENLLWLNESIMNGAQPSDYDANGWKDFYKEYLNHIYNLDRFYDEIEVW